MKLMGIFLIIFALTCAKVNKISDGQGGENVTLAVDDYITVEAGKTLTVDVLANDSAKDNRPLTITAISLTDGGTTTIINGKTMIQFTAHASSEGMYCVDYHISDGLGGISQAKLTITILSPGRFSNTNFGNSSFYNFLNNNRWEVILDENDRRFFLNTSSFDCLTGDRVGEHAIVVSETFIDFKFNLKVKGEDPAINGSADYALIFGFVDENNYNYMMMNARSDLTELFAVTSGEREMISNAGISGVPDSGYHDVKLTRSGNIVKVFLDNVEILTATDARLGFEGKVGVGSYNDLAYFDNIDVRDYNAECGNGNLEKGEECDDGNTISGDGCSETCLIEIQTPVCGNGKLETGEECDDGNTTSGDGCSSSCELEGTGWPEYPLLDGKAEFTIDFHPDQPAEGVDGLRATVGVADMDGDGLMDYIVMSKEGRWDAGLAGMGVYKHDGSVLWYKHDIDIYINGNAENHGLPGWSAPGYSKGDIDGDNQFEIVYIKENKETLVILNGKTGSLEKTIDLDPQGNEPGFGLCQIVNLRGQGDRDLICQGWDIDHFNIIAAFRLDTGARLWRRTDYVGVKHGGFRAVDIDGDGKDEVAGAVIIDDNGDRMNSWNYPITINTHSSPHFDSIFIYDVRPDKPGIEIVLLEEIWSGEVDYTSVVSPSEIIWRKKHNGWEPQNAAVGNFDTSLSGLEIWCRSRFDSDQKPWVHDANGDVITTWVMNEKKPANWSVKGIEEINVIDWDGSEKQLIAAKERHTEGKVAVINPMTGDFIKVWENKANDIRVVDVAGDWREEIIVFNKEDRKIFIYWNPASNSISKPRHWTKNYYLRQKDNFNYYSP